MILNHFFYLNEKLQKINELLKMFCFYFNIKDEHKQCSFWVLYSASCTPAYSQTHFFFLRFLLLKNVSLHSPFRQEIKHVRQQIKKMDACKCIGYYEVQEPRCSSEAITAIITQVNMKIDFTFQTSSYTLNWTSLIKSVYCPPLDHRVYFLYLVIV